MKSVRDLLGLHMTHPVPGCNSEMKDGLWTISCVLRNGHAQMRLFRMFEVHVATPGVVNIKTGSLQGAKDTLRFENRYFRTHSTIG